MADVIVSVTLTEDQKKAAMDHFGTTNPIEAKALFQAWISNEANGWYQAYLKKDIDRVVTALYADPTQIAAIMAALAI